MQAVKDDFNRNKSVYYELNKHIPKDAHILHIADDFGQKDILLTPQQASRRIFSFIKNEEKRRIAEQMYLVKKRKITYINKMEEINKKIDILLISDRSFDISTLLELPETIIFMNVKSDSFNHADYSSKFGSETLKIFSLE